MKRGLARSVRSFEKFNRRTPTKLERVAIDDKTPLICLGPCPEISYISGKEGRGRFHYRHKTGYPRPKIYAHPDGKFFLIIGGRVRVSDWLRG